MTATERYYDTPKGQRLHRLWYRARRKWLRVMHRPDYPFAVEQMLYHRQQRLFDAWLKNPQR